MGTGLNLRYIDDDVKDMIEKDRRKLGMSQREYIEYLSKAEHERLKDDQYLLEQIKNKN